MFKKLNFLLICIFGLVFIFSQTTSAQSKPDEFLGGLDALGVDVQLAKELEQYNLLNGDILLDVIAQLQKGGLSVNFKSKNTLKIFVNAVKIDDSFISYSIDGFLLQPVILERRKTVNFNAPTWQMKTMGAVTTNKIEIIPETIKNLTNKFILDYSASNKSSSKQQSSPDVFDELAKIFLENKKDQDNSPFTAVYVGGNRPPEVEIFNDTDRTFILISDKTN